MKKIDLVGQRFGKLLVIANTTNGERGGITNTRVLCTCDCGKTKIIHNADLRSGDTNSCGCNQFWIAYNQTQENHWNWKGNNLSYKALHQWLIDTFGNPEYCELCGLTGQRIKNKWNIHWAKFKERGYERKRENFWALCVICHHRYDNLGFKKGNNYGSYKKVR